MSKRIILVTLAASFVASLALGQMKYSRSKAQSPTPTPTPTPLPSIPAQRGTSAPRTAAIPPKQSPTPPPRVLQTANQPKAMPTPLPRGMQPAMQPKGTPLPRIPAAQMPAQRPIATATPIPPKPTPTPVPPPDIRTYLDRQLAKSKDQKFHMNVNGGDLALTPFHFWPQKSTGPNTTSTVISMRSDEGRVYDIDFMTTGAQVTSIRINRINGESVR